MMNPTIITIGREYASGGHIIGQIVAERLGYTFYDRELIRLTAEQSGFSEKMVERAETHADFNLLTNQFVTKDTLPLSDQVFIAQANVIREIAQKGHAVIVGRSADWLLHHQQHCLRVFIHAPYPIREKRAREEYGVQEKDMRAFLQKQDKARAAHYTDNTGRRWGQVQNYHLCIDSGMGIDFAADAICWLAKKLQEEHAQ